jgi:DUF438 domain-containing protein
MKKCDNQNIAEELTGLLLKLSEGKNDTHTRKQANRLISQIGPNDIAHAERRLLENGLSLKKVQQLSAAFVLMGALDGNDNDLRHRLADSHILRKAMAEHELIRCFLAELEEVNDQIQRLEKFTSASSEIMELSHIAEHLNAMQEHVDREDDVLFPALKEFGWESLFGRIQNDHTYLKMAVKDMVKLTITFEKMPPSTFKARLANTVHYLCPMMREHLFHEDKVLFPLAVAMIEDEKIWQKLKSVCRDIGYCGVHL